MNTIDAPIISETCKPRLIDLGLAPMRAVPFDELTQHMGRAANAIGYVMVPKCDHQKGVAALALLEKIEPHIDAIVCYASSTDEHEPNQLALDVRKLLGKA